MKIYAGTSGFAYKEWKGTFYPEKIAPEEMLRSYARRLGAVEINNTFYRMPTEKLLEGWASRVPRSFRFAFKAPQTITHFKRLRHVDDEIGYLFDTLSILGPRLGPVLFQLPGSFRADRPALEDFLARIPLKPACAFEFRHPSWLEDGVFELLHKKGCALCIADTDESPAAEITATASWGYLRLRRADYSDGELLQWAKRILSQKWKHAFVFVKHEDGGRGPLLAQRLGELAGNPSPQTKISRGAPW
jgi:uncharacterized protein YecE (DUF72 family)